MAERDRSGNSYKIALRTVILGTPVVDAGNTATRDFEVSRRNCFVEFGRESVKETLCEGFITS